MNRVPGSLLCDAVRKAIRKATSSRAVLAIVKKGASRGLFDASVFGAAMKRCGALRDCTTALRLFRRMSRLGIEASAIEYGIIIDALAKNDQLARALSIASEIRHPDVAVFNSLIAGCKHRCDVALAEQLWHRVRAESSPDLVTVNTMLSVYARANCMGKAEALWRRMFESESPKLSPDAVTLATMMNGYSVARDKRKVLAMQHWMESHTMPLTATHYGAMMRCHLKERQPLDALDLFHHEIERKLSPSQINELLVHQLLCAYLQCMESLATESETTNASKKRMGTHYAMMSSTIPRKYRYSARVSMGVLMDAALLYYDRHSRLIPMFESAMARGELHGYWKRNGHAWLIDLHRHSLRTAASS